MTGVVVLFLGSSAFAGTASIEGVIVGPNGSALGGSEIRAQRIDVKAAPLQTRSDSKGRYAFNDIAQGNYTVTTAVKGVATSSRTVTTKANGHTRLDLDLRKDRSGKTAAAKPPPTPENPGAADVSRMQRSLGGNINGMTFPGH